jgi:two-component system CheB/CheR fusion protein
MHMPVDYFFRSLARVQGSEAIGVILSGSASDGALGMAEIKAAGGITFAQDDRTAGHAGMPQSAVRSGCVDLVLSPEGIARELARIGRHPYLTPAAQTVARSPETTAEKDHFRKILALLHSAFGVDFSAYRDTTIKRRITRRMVLHTKDSLADYARHLERNRAELDALYQDILINVTSFFREPDTFETLKNRVFPAILEGKNPNTPIRIWAPGCSTGQEAYSLAIALLEFLDDKPVHPPIQIFATDLSDTVSLQKAREGIYPENIEAEVSPERLRRFFSKEDSRYRVSKALRDMVVFARQNVAADPPFSRMDLISCRNLLIYLAPPLQRRVIPTFHYALNPTGFLVLGHSETVGAFTDLFGVVDSQHRIYAKNATAARQYPHFQAEEHRLGAGHARPLVAPPAVSPADWQREADRVALGQYAPPGVLVNENLDILQFRGQTGPYLAPAPGEPSLNLLKMAREGLFLAVRAAVRECQQQGAAVHTQGVRVRGESVDREIALHVLPIKLSNADQRCYLVLFEEEAQRPRPPEVARPEPAGIVDAAELNVLRQELASTREYLQSVIEQQEAANEELRSANEEILSSNEELQSTNEELETAKEELQSVNEELTTVNEQLQNRNLDLGRLNDELLAARNYAEAILRTTREPLVVLCADLRVNTANEAFYKTFQATPEQTEGKLLYDLGNGQWAIPGLRTLLEDILPRKSSFEDFEVEHEFRAIGRRIMLLNARQLDTADGGPELILLAITDITEHRRMQDEQTLAAHELRRFAAELSEMDRRRNEFLALLAHELRNPLAPILNAQHLIRLAEERKGTADAEETLRSASAMIGRQTEHLARLVEDLLDVSRISRGTIGLRSKRIDLASVIHHSVEAARPRCQDHELTIALPPDPIYMYGDPVRLVQIVGNLLNNACKFTDQGGSIGLRVEQVGQQAVLRVWDNGIGIAAEQLPRIFDMFTQVETSLERSHGGLGIGLTLVKSLVELHGGTVEAHSAGLGQGCELVVRLPILAEEPEPLAPAAGDPAPTAPRRILVVDDNRDTAESLALLLELAGPETHTPIDGAEAVEAAAAFRPDIILLDIGLPKLNGYEAARQIRKQQGGKSLALVALTGWGQAEDRRRSEEAGFDAHLVKPVDLGVLKNLLAELQPAERSKSNLL